MGDAHSSPRTPPEPTERLVARVKVLLWARARVAATFVRQHLERSATLEPQLQKIDRYRRVTALRRSVIFDREFYEVQANRRFGSSRAALAHFLDTGLNAGLSISPFFNAEWYRYHTAPAEETGFLSFFFDGDGLHTTAPHFDARVYASALIPGGRPAPATGREALEGFLRSADAATLLPVHETCAGLPTLGEARATALESGREMNRQEHFVRPRLSDDWTPDPLPVRATTTTASSASASAGTPQVSVIMPVRNRVGVVSDAIRSVLAQTTPNWALIVVDDGSDDGTIEVLEEFVALDSRISLIRQQPSGVCAARNAGLHAAGGDYVAFLDSDNVWVPEFLERTVLALHGTSAIGSHAAVELVDESGTRQFLAFSGDREDLLYGGNFIDLNTLVTRRAAVLEVGGFDEDLRRWVDYDLVIRLFAAGEFLFLPFVGVIYSHRGDLDRISTRESPGWEQVVLSKYLLDWETIIERAPERPRDLVSIVMLTYADWRFTLDAVRSVLDNSTDIRFEILVVDNGSPRMVREILSAGLVGDPRVRHVPLSRNTNFALGSNIGFAEAHGSLIVFLNDDVEVQPGWLEPLVETLAKNADVAAAQPLILTSTGAIQSAGIDLVAPDFLPRDRVALVPGQSRNPLSAVSGVAAIVRAVDFADQHGFDPIYANGLEDADLALRMTQNRPRKFALVERSRITHFSIFSPGRFVASAANARVFTDRWRTSLEGRARSGHPNGVTL
jgi:glycosyltransferase involved in cell wall biosynthesis